MIDFGAAIGDLLDRLPLQGKRMLQGIETVVYFVEDLNAATRWYREALGVAPNHESPYYVGFTVAGYELGLHPVEASAHLPGTEGQTAYWSVSNVEDAIAHFVAHGATAHHEVTDVGGGIKIASVLDPFGNEVGLIENPASPNQR